MMKKKSKNKTAATKKVVKDPKNKKAVTTKVVKELVQKEWIFLTTEDMDVAALKNILEEAYELEIWEAAGVLEVTLPSGEGVDFEETTVRDNDTLLLEQMEAENMQRIYLVTVGTESKEEFTSLFQKILAETEGLFLADNENLTPVIKRTDKE
ncbi:MAG: hypothetical protein MRZ75_06075 [Roseburia sp.]|uniref:hypothetical protein n=1 Tax=Roseburia sp. 831b TaxID=1261635 RepID=UPI00117B471D|nr:hypothetical protein [Roseburia sp. 831b]MCI5918872.1 hypothetical protein [Roseburia sp.]MDD6216980.1 hypothetical protein [Roseburia sp.]MDY5882559.1 hypothetical protein [Roseburia sp.]WVK72158.1 hypothetical protein BIV16_10205 [Roseburia sp. 831b]